MSFNLVFNSLNYNTYIIAEIGINHEGSFSLCKEMVYAAKEAGVKAVKLQTIDPDKSYANDTESYRLFSMSKLTKTETKKIFELSKNLGLEIFTTVGDIETANWIKSLKPSAWKISSSLLTHIPLISHIAKFREKKFISTGLAKNKEIKDIVEIFGKKRNNFSLLHCVSKYPTEVDEINLSRIQFLKNKYNVEVGYSDHSKGVLASCLAIAKGATIIEKHFTFDKKRHGFDHKISLDYKGMKNLVNNVIETEKIISVNKSFLKTIEVNRKKFLRVLVANKKILKGRRLNEKNLSIKRVRNNKNGLSPSYYEKLLGKLARKTYKKDEVISKIELNND